MDAEVEWHLLRQQRQIDALAIAMGRILAHTAQGDPVLARAFDVLLERTAQDRPDAATSEAIRAVRSCMDVRLQELLHGREPSAPPPRSQLPSAPQEPPPR